MARSRGKGGKQRAARRPAPVAALAAVLGVLGPGGSAGAADWRVTPQASLQQTWSDNINLASKGLETSAFVTDVNPSVSVRGRGRRLELNLDYNLQAVVLGRDKVGNKLSNQLQANTTAELYEQVLFMDARATMSQQNISNTGPQSSDNISGPSSNRTDVMTFSVSPYVRHRLGSWAESEVRYTFDNVANSQGAANSSSTRVRGEFKSGDRFQKIPWKLDYSSQKIDNESGTTSEFQQIRGRVSYVFNRKITGFVEVGLDRNDFASSQSSNDGRLWSVGVDWTPTPRTRIEAGLTDRYFGSNFFLDLSHQSRRTTWKVRFAEDTTTTRQDQLDRVLVPLEDAFGDPIIDPITGAESTVPVNNAALTEEVIVSEQFRGSVAFRGRRTNANLGVFHTIRSFQVSDLGETVFGFDASVSRGLSSRTSAGVNASWQQTEPAGLGRTDVRLQGAAFLTHRIGRDLDGRLEYRYQQQSSDVAAAEHEENRITAFVSVRF